MWELSDAPAVEVDQPWFAGVGEGDLGHLGHGQPDEGGLRDLAKEPTALDEHNGLEGMWRSLAAVPADDRWRLLLEYQGLLGAEGHAVLERVAESDAGQDPLRESLAGGRRLLAGMVSHPEAMVSVGPIARYGLRLDTGLIKSDVAEAALDRIGRRGVDLGYVEAESALVSLMLRSADFARGYRIARLLDAFTASTSGGVRLASLTALWTASGASLRHRFDEQIDAFGSSSLEEYLDQLETMGPPDDVAKACRAAALFAQSRCGSLDQGKASAKRLAADVRHLRLASGLLATAQRIAPDNQPDQTLYQLAMVRFELVSRQRCPLVVATATAKVALGHLDPTTKAVARVDVADRSWRSGGPRPDFGTLLSSAQEIRDRVSVAFAWHAVFAAAHLALDVGNHEACLTLLDQAVSLARHDCAHRLGEAYRLQVHAGDRGRVDCGVVVGLGHQSLPTPEQLAPDQVAAVLAHLSQHCQEPLVACELAAAAVGAPPQAADVALPPSIAAYVRQGRGAGATRVPITDARIWQWATTLADHARSLAAEQPDSAARRALCAVANYAGIGVVGDAIEAAELLSEILVACREETAAEVVLRLPATAAVLVAELVPDRLSVWENLAQCIDAPMRHWPAWMAVLHHRLFKGLAFDAMLGHPPDPQAGTGGPSMALVEAHDDGAAALRLPAHQAEAAVCSVFDPAERYPGRTADETRANAWRTYDAEVQGVSMANAVARLGPEEISAALPLTQRDTLVVSYFNGRSSRDSLASTVMVFHGDSVTSTKLLDEKPAREIRFIGDDSVTWRVREEGLAVVNLRDQLRLDPGPKVATPAARVLLDELAKRYVAPTANVLLDQYHAGARHLVIWPHGPLHFLPFALLPIGGNLLCDLFTVTTVPALRALNPRPRTRVSTVPLLVAAYPTAGREQGLPDVPVLDEQADAIAATVAGSIRLSESGATAEALLEAMESARWVHIAAHGDQMPHAPAFQSLHVTGTPLRAHHFWGRDLSAVDVVTLSACESALGRVDVADNMRGLAASLLVAGVAAVVATLWPANAGPARTFYVEFYAALGSGLGSVAAFARAQRTTRDRWPEYRHWAAFTYIGSERD